MIPRIHTAASHLLMAKGVWQVSIFVLVAQVRTWTRAPRDHTLRSCFLDSPDGEVEDTRALRRDVSREIRRFRPDLVTFPS